MEQKHIFSVEVEDKPMVLVRIASLFSRRGFNIDSLTVGNTNKKGISRFTIVIYGDNKTLEQVRKQTQKIIHVLTSFAIGLSSTSTEKICFCSIFVSKLYNIELFQQFYQSIFLLWDTSQKKSHKN